ncbi:trypsin-like serine protease [Microvirga sp. W0021]|uniref:Trypsin-like serine protease n=1 Tax=Hohaiivirga grylli TaxID=3133970 RepID=A0ABV0BIE9_9HYPH
MKKLLAATLAILLIPGLANAITQGKAARDKDGLRSSVVRIENSAGELCSGVLVSSNAVLTAAHCVTVKSSYWVTVMDRKFQSKKLTIAQIVRSPSFDVRLAPTEQTGVDLALIRLSEPAPDDMEPLTIHANIPVRMGDEIYVAGFGSTSYANIKSARTLRVVSLSIIKTKQPPNDLVIAADPKSYAMKTGAGACRGDSGGPAFVFGPEGYGLGGILSWSSSALGEKNSSPCGGITAITPLAPNILWIMRNINAWKQ